MNRPLRYILLRLTAAVLFVAAALWGVEGAYARTAPPAELPAVEEPTDSSQLADSAELAPPPPMDLPAKVAIVVRDIATAADIVERNADAPMSPASILKCVTSASAMLDGLSDRRFTTSAYTEGEIRDRQLWGNIVIEASGDPTTDSRHFAENAGLADSIAAAVAALGLDSIRGSIVIDASLVPADGPSPFWLDEDYKYSYGAGHYAINYRDNTVGNSDRAMEDPTGEFYDSLYAALERRGVWVLDEDTAPEGTPQCIYRRESPTGAEIMRSMMVRSDNMFAEGMLRALAPGEVTTEAVRREKRLLTQEGLDTLGLIIYDGSGLSRENRVSASFMARLLSHMATGSYGQSYVSLFPKTGVEGTVRRFMKDTPLEGRLVLKSGSMRGVQCYAGYRLDDAGHPTHVVVIMTNEFTCPRKEVVDAARLMLLDAFGFNDKMREE